MSQVPPSQQLPPETLLITSSFIFYQWNAFTVHLQVCLQLSLLPFPSTLALLSSNPSRTFRQTYSFPLKLLLIQSYVEYDQTILLKEDQNCYPPSICIYSFVSQGVAAYLYLASRQYFPWVKFLLPFFRDCLSYFGVECTYTTGYILYQFVY